MKTERTIEEVREKDRERAARWRAKNRVLSRERVAYWRGKSKYPGLVEERMRDGTKERYGVKSGQERINHVITGEITSVIEDPEDSRTPGERAMHERRVAAYRKKVGQKGPIEERVVAPVSDNELKAVEDLARLIRRRKGVEVELEV
jgi:hypothetical protein